MIRKGDSVELLDDTLSGIVKTVEDGTATIETKDGFEIKIPLEKLIKKADFQIDHKKLRDAIRSKSDIRGGKRNKNQRRTAEKPMEVDLHISELVSTTKNMSDYDMLNLQLDTARRRLEFAIEHHIQRIVFIHGVGKGVLRMELETLLRKYDQVEFYDAEFQKYGRGATEVYIYQNY